MRINFLGSADFANTTDQSTHFYFVLNRMLSRDNGRVHIFAPALVHFFLGKHTLFICGIHLCLEGTLAVPRTELSVSSVQFALERKKLNVAARANHQNSLTKRHSGCP
jgi:hypothetical protein